MIFDGLGRHFAEGRNGATAFICRKIAVGRRLANIVSSVTTSSFVEVRCCEVWVWLVSGVGSVGSGLIARYLRVSSVALSLILLQQNKHQQTRQHPACMMHVPQTFLLHHLPWHPIQSLPCCGLVSSFV